MIKCPLCQTDNPDESQFCSNCGEKIKRNPEAVKNWHEIHKRLWGNRNMEQDIVDEINELITHVKSY